MRDRRDRRCGRDPGGGGPRCGPGGAQVPRHDRLGDASFVKNFNPFTGTGLPSGTIVQGAFYEPLLVTPLGKTSPQPWLAHSYSWTNHNRTLRLNLVHNARLVGR
jgi:ABC-type transport system substrate-binding protein